MTEVSASNSDGPDSEELSTLQSVLSLLQTLEPNARQRILATVSAFYGFVPYTSPVRPSNAPQSTPLASSSGFSTDRTPSPKDFLFEKRPQTDVDRIACLAYYLTHYRDTPHFKTLDLSKLNTEAAQLKLSNAAYATDNAARAGLLVPASKGTKQLSALGELYVEALPDRAAAREAIARAKPRRNKRRGAKNGGVVDAADSSE